MSPPSFSPLLLSLFVMARPCASQALPGTHPPRWAEAPQVRTGPPFRQSSLGVGDEVAGRKSHVLAGMGIGLASGTVLGGVVGAVTCSRSHPDSDDEVGKALCILAYAGAGAGVGLLIGGVVGIAEDRARTPAGILQRVRLEPIFRPAPALGVSLSFSFHGPGY